MPAVFEETQRFLRRGIAVALVGALAAVSVIAWVQFRPGLPGPRQLLLVLPVAAVALVIFMELRVTVQPDALRIRMLPLVDRTIRRGEIARAEARTYHPIREYGGWGVRIGRGKRAYSVSGDRGVELILADGMRVMIGSRRADDLAAAIHGMSG
ncbi:MAG TPA: hypothetical protein VGQ33_06425 [Vicinamibacteria bacterium]|jgi:hypothetical protein|nr:hypothetical protein [Vicinamibacteria bacterium]